MASDSLWINGNGRRDYEAAKLWSGHGLLLGWAGAAPYALGFRDWLRGGAEGESPQLGGPQGTEILLSLPDGRLCTVTHDGWEWYHADMAAIGSGADFALGAMAQGATPEQAVAHAIRFDTNSGGPVNVVRRC